MAVVAILEDDAGRREAMALHLPPGVEAHWFERADRMIAWLTEHLERCALISLDHDLIGPPGDDPGDGRQVADHMAARTPGARVIVHTSNPLAAPGMMFELERADWTVERVVPFSDLEWVERAWAPALIRGLQGA